MWSGSALPSTTCREINIEQLLILLHQRILRLGQNELERCLVEILKCRHDRKPADQFRDQAVLEQVFRLDVAEDLALLSILGRYDITAEADRARPAARRNDLLEASEGTATDEQDVGRIDLQVFLLRMLAAALRWHARHCAFNDFEQRLLHALAGHVADDRGIVGLARYLVDLVDIDDTA